MDVDRSRKCNCLKQLTGGESGIRTHVRVSPKHAFQACAFSHSAISPARNSSIISENLFSVLKQARLSAAIGNFAFAADAVAIARQNRIEPTQKPGERRDSHHQAGEKREGHAHKDLAEGIRAGVSTAIGKDQVHGLFAVFQFQEREKTEQLGCLIGHGVKLFEPVEAMQPLQITGTDSAGAVIDHYGFDGFFHISILASIANRRGSTWRTEQGYPAWQYARSKPYSSITTATAFFPRMVSWQRITRPMQLTRTSVSVPSTPEGITIRK